MELLTGAQWRKSRRSDESGDNCIEVANVPTTVAVRDSKDPSGPKLLVDRDNFRRFAETVKTL
ncbi:DUF397 domain-containing protein [Actinomadura flavalba]|uniref:DUF397 domain-containing protein n=1 Tax=Actinomadura flavalba TaxID=1120938 RepID=UPI00036E19B8|nr:DUF397 domain-containing protein [Actinomadura flavalba]